MVANIFELKNAFIQIVQQTVHFDELPDEHPNAHITNCLEVCDMSKINRALEDAIRL